MSAVLTISPVKHDVFEELEAAQPLCRAIVIVPARNEEDSLEATLDALRVQEEIDGRPLAYDRYEVLLLLNNCTDESALVARQYAADHAELRLHVAECVLPRAEAHVGTARRALMDAACARLEALEGRASGAILSTDADTRVARDWVARNLAEIERGAEVVGGVIHLLPEDVARLDCGTRRAYERDRELQRLTAKLEALLDPDPADPWPRHLEHFGASLACTPEVYRRSGGLPAVTPLEDVAFVDALRRVGARIRHAPEVMILTSGRLDGRAAIGLSRQLREWRDEVAAGLPQRVESAEWLEHRFAEMAELRRGNGSAEACDSRCYPAGWRERMEEARALRLATPRFLEVIDCDGLIEEMFRRLPGAPARWDEIGHVLARLHEIIRRLEDVRGHQAGTGDGGAR